VRTEKKLQAVDSWRAWRTLQTWLYLNVIELRQKISRLITCRQAHGTGKAVFDRPW